jgi:quercetin dioxygenase-like cupin family protein
LQFILIHYKLKEIKIVLFIYYVELEVNSMSKPINIEQFWARPINAADFIEYQEGSVVSRTLISRPTGTVTLFAFDTDQGLSEHTAPFDAMVILLDGQAEITISGQPHLVSAGQIIIMPAGEPHALQAVEKFKMLLVMIKS